MNKEQQLFQLLIQIRNQPEFAPLREFLEDRMQMSMRACIHQTGDALFRAQGRAQEMSDLIGLIANAPATLEKLSAQMMGAGMQSPQQPM